MPLASGARLGPYHIITLLGSGGMGDVYRARDTRLERDVAIKVLPPEVTHDRGRLERFDREARVIAALNHPHIVTIYSTEAHEGVRFLTMELVEGHTLASSIVPGGLPVPRVLEIAIPLADALTAAHQKQITHRDLKPTNVMLSKDGRVKVLDFGLARMAGADIDERSLTTQAPITQRGMIVGTMPYMSPEQVEGRALDARSDLFSLGVILYEMLSGERPFRGGSGPAVMAAILRDTPPELYDRRADVPMTLSHLVDRCIEKRAEDRIQTARDVFNELRHIQKELEAATGRGTRVGDSGIRAAAPASAAQPSPVSLRTGIDVAVRPFTYAGSEETARFVADGLTSDVATGLARFPYVRVIAQGAAQRGAASPAQYVVEGEVRASSRSMRISARLIDVSTGVSVWADTYRRDASVDAFELVDDVASHVVATLADGNGALPRAYAAAAKDGRDSPTLTLTLRFNVYGQHFTPEEHARWRQELEPLVEAEPHNPRAWAYLGIITAQEKTVGFNPRPNAGERARQAAERAIAIDTSNQVAWLARAWAAYIERDLMAFRGAAERAIELNPLHTLTMATIGLFMTYFGETARGAELVRRAMSLNPNHPGWYHIALFLAAYRIGDADHALTHAKRITMPQIPLAAIFVAAAAGRFERAADAKSGVDELQRSRPELVDPRRLRAALARWLWDDVLLDRLIEGFEKALRLAAREA